MNKFQLFLETRNEDLFRKATSELGTLFYRLADKDQYEIVYFSGSRIARFNGKLSEAFAVFVKTIGHQVTAIEFDETSGSLKVKEA